MASSTNGQRRYSIDFSDVVAEQLKTAQRRATRRGQGKAFAAAFRRIVRALRKDPNAVGELLYRLPVLRLRVRTVAVAPLVIDSPSAKIIPSSTSPVSSFFRSRECSRRTVHVLVLLVNTRVAAYTTRL